MPTVSPRPSSNKALCPDQVNDKMMDVAFKQVRPGKQEVSIGEDMQQLLIGIVAVLNFGGARFIWASCALNLSRVVASIILFHTLKMRNSPKHFAMDKMKKPLA